MAIGYRGGATDGGAANPTGTINITNHASAAKGDLAIVQIYSRDGSTPKNFGTISGPTAITGYPANTANGGKVWLGYKVLTATDITNGYLGTWAPTTLANATTGVSVAGFSGVKASAPVSGQGTPTAGGASDPDPPALVATSGHTLIICFGTMDQNDGVTAPTSPTTFTLTTAANWSSTSGTDGSGGMAYALAGGTGSSLDPAAFVTTTDAYWYTGHIALAPQPAPAVTSLDVTSGTTAGGTTVVITGTSFYGASAVTIGGHAATSYNVVSDTSISMVTAAHAAEADLQVQVTGPGGASADVAGDNYSYVADAGAVSFDPFGMSGFFGM
jgi:hypothetical protein